MRVCIFHLSNNDELIILIDILITNKNKINKRIDIYFILFSRALFFKYIFRQFLNKYLILILNDNLKTPHLFIHLKLILDIT